MDLVYAFAMQKRHSPSGHDFPTISPIWCLMLKIAKNKISYDFSLGEICFLLSCIFAELFSFLHDYPSISEK